MWLDLINPNSNYTMDYTKFNFNSFSNTTSDVRLDVGLRNYMVSVYKHMAVALLITGIISLFTASSQVMMGLLMSPLGMVIVFAPLAISLFMAFKFRSMSPEGVRACLYLYAGTIGLSIASIFLIYTGDSIARTFFISASTFGAMSIYGYSTKKDLSSWGSFIMMGVLGIILASLVNIFMRSNTLTLMISFVGVILFTGLAAYDTQKIKDVYYSVSGHVEAEDKMALYGAMALYIDFINLFLFMLRFVGQRRSD